MKRNLSCTDNEAESIKAKEDEKCLDKLWTAACCGDLDTLKHYYGYESKIINRRYVAFGREHSLIMGAFRNNQFEVVYYLIGVGETITPEEKIELMTEIKRMEIMKSLVDIK